MKNLKSLILVCLTSVVSIVISCHSTKKSSTTTTTTKQNSEPSKDPTATTTSSNTSSSNIRNGIIPGELELKAIQLNYPDVTAQTLTAGHEIYIGQCTDCHRKKNIFVYSESKWKEIIDDMAQRSQLTAKQKDEVYKYVLAMKATENAYAK